MKPYNVKSNAKRFARGVAAKHPEYLEAIEPVETTEGSREWFPAVRLVAESAEAFISDDVASVTKIMLPSGEFFGEPEIDALAASLSEFVGKPFTEETASAMGERVAEFLDEETDASGLKAMFDEVPPVGDVDAVAGMSASTFFEGDGFPEAPPEVYDGNSFAKSRPDIAAMAGAIPPLVPRTREEIEAARAARRERVAKEKAEGIRTASGDRVQPVKIIKKKIILDLVRRKGGATQAELEAATGWQRHTLRGYIAGTLRKQMQPLGLEIECIRGKGEEPTRYRIPMMDAARAEGGAA